MREEWWCMSTVNLGTWMFDVKTKRTHEKIKQNRIRPREENYNNNNGNSSIEKTRMWQMLFTKKKKKGCDKCVCSFWKVGK